MDFLDHIYFSNTTRSYLSVIAIVLGIVLFKRYLSRFIAALCFRRVKKVWTTVNRDSFFDLVVGPIDWFLVVVISVFALDKLSFPEELHFHLYGHSLQDIFNRIGTAVIILAFTWLALRLVDFVALVLEEKANQTVDIRDNQLIVFFRDFLKVFVGISGVLLIIKACFHQPLGNVLTGLSLVGAAMALAAKESLENLIASFIIFFDKPFFTGDVVKVNAVIGSIEKIGLRSTRIRTGDKTLVTVPNKQMVDSMVDNWSMRTERRAELKLELAAATTAATLENITAAINQLIKDKTAIVSSAVVLKDISKNGILLSVEYFTAAVELSEYDLLKQEIILQIKKLTEGLHIEFAQPVTIREA
jgi:MscS family membrane protein